MSLLVVVNMLPPVLTFCKYIGAVYRYVYQTGGGGGWVWWSREVCQKTTFFTWFFLTTFPTKEKYVQLYCSPHIGKRISMYQSWWSPWIDVKCITSGLNPIKLFSGTNMWNIYLGGDSQCLEHFRRWKIVTGPGKLRWNWLDESKKKTQLKDFPV